MKGFKGEPGDSAYDIAVKNGFIGTEQDWLAQLGTANAFSQETTSYVTTTENQTIFALPSGYTSNSFLDIYINGLKLSNNEFTINTSNNTITLNNGVESIGTTVEVVVTSMTTSELPIVTEVNENSTDTTAPSSKCVYNIKKDILDSQEEISNAEIDALFEEE